jgi:hypothetical protein
LGAAPCRPSYVIDTTFETHLKEKKILAKTLRGPTDDIRNTWNPRAALDTAMKGRDGISVLSWLPAKRDREAL